MHLRQQPVNRLHRASGRQAQHQVRIRAQFLGDDPRHQRGSGISVRSNDDFHAAELTTNEHEWTRRKKGNVRGPRADFGGSPNRSAVASPSPPQKGGEGRGEEAVFHPSLQLSPRSFLAGREGKRPSAFLCRTLFWCPATWTERGSPSPFATSTPPGGMPTAKNRRSAVQIGPAEHNTGRRGNPIADSGGQDARLYGRQEAWPLQPKLFAILLT